MAITPTISSVGIGAGASGLDVGAIIDKLMTAEAVPLGTFDKKTASYQAKLSALGALSGAVSTFQGSLSHSPPEQLPALSAPRHPIRSCSRPALAPRLSQAATTSTSPSWPRRKRSRRSAWPANCRPSAAAPRPRFPSSWARRWRHLWRNWHGTERQHPAHGREQRLAGHQWHGHSDGRASTKSARALADAINAKSSTTGVTATAQPTASNASMFNGFGTSKPVRTAPIRCRSAVSRSLPRVTASPQAMASRRCLLDTTLEGLECRVEWVLAAANITVTGKAAGTAL